MWYNKIMKLLIKIFLFMVMMVLPQTAKAITFNVVVLPVDVLNVCTNYYCFPEASEILADDIIKYFNKDNKVKSPDLYTLRAGLSANMDLYNVTASIVRKYDYNNSIDYAGIKKLARSFDAKSVLLISSVVTSNKGLSKRSVWEVLEIASVFDIEQPFTLDTDAVLIDTVNDIVMWSGSYSRILGEKSKFTARNASQANSKLDTLRMYFEDMVAQDIVQNVVLRFFPKTINPLERAQKTDKNEIYKSGSMLQFEKKLPKPKSEEKQDVSPEDELGEMIFGI